MSYDGGGENPLDSNTTFSAEPRCFTRMAQKVLLFGDNTFPFHQLDEMEAPLRRALGPAPDISSSTDPAVLLTLDQYDVIVDYSTDTGWTDAQIAALNDFVSDGGGYLGIHCATVLDSMGSDDPDTISEKRDEPHPVLRSLIGGHFIGHPEQSEFAVRIEQDHPVTAGVEDFTVFDEPYRVDVSDDITVLARMDHPDLDAYPIVWVREHGEGRVCYISIGHTEEVLETTETRQLIRNALAWVDQR